MHDTAFQAGALFANVYGSSQFKVLDVGGQNYNGSLRNSFEILGMHFTSLDIQEHESVDVVMQPGKAFPFENQTFDLVISTSCFEHDPCFWMTFKEMCRVVKKSGYIYVNAPSNGVYHAFPGDNWRFYTDSAQSLAYWSGIPIHETSWPVKIVETFFVLPKKDIWTDFVCVWQRTDIPETEITVSNEIKNFEGPLKKALHNTGFATSS